jgi:hypothetical protein
MSRHFIFEPGEWLGAGQVSFSVSPDVLYFRTKWTGVEQDAHLYVLTQIVEIVGGDRIVNYFSVTLHEGSTFNIVLKNELLGTFTGSGVLEDGLVAWEFRYPGVFEGYEVYERSHETEYTMHAEYLSSDQSRTSIRGRIWKKHPNDTDLMG